MSGRSAQGSYAGGCSTQPANELLREQHGAEQMTVRRAMPDTHEALLHDVLHSDAVFDFGTDWDTRWLSAQAGHRAIGVVDDPGQASDPPTAGREHRTVLDSVSQPVATRAATIRRPRMPDWDQRPPKAADANARKQQGGRRYATSSLEPSGRGETPDVSHELEPEGRMCPMERSSGLQGLCLIDHITTLRVRP